MSRLDFWERRLKESAVLSPIDRTSEVLFGLIMVLTFTGAISAASAGREEVRELLWAALGCNVAWGLVDAVMYWMNVLLERGHALKSILKIRGAADSTTSREALIEEMQPLIVSLTTNEELDQLVDRIKKLPDPAENFLLPGMDMVSGLQIFRLVFFCTLPVAIPFAIFSEVAVAMRVSNGVALLMLFLGGYRLAHYAGFRPLVTAFVYALIGVLLVALTMVLGG